MDCVVCNTDSNFLEYSINHRPLSEAISDLAGTVLPVCDTCYNAGYIYWCPRCTTGYTLPRDSKDYRVVTYDTCTVVVCDKCSLSKKSAITECDVDECEARVRPSHRITPHNRIYCAEHWGEMTRCAARYCNVLINPDDSEITRVRQGIAYCNRCYFRRLPGNFPIHHPNAWDFRPECSCSACRFLAGVDDQPYWESLSPANYARRRGICDQCEDQGIAEADLLTFGERNLCHSCLYDRVVTCTGCNEDVLHEMVHGVALSGAPPIDAGPVDAPEQPRRTTGRSRFAEAFGAGTRIMGTQATVTSTDNLPPPLTMEPNDLDDESNWTQVPVVSSSAMRQRARSIGSESGDPPVVTPPLPSTPICDSCMIARATHWLCSVRCSLWYTNGQACGCDGIHRWSYKPEVFLFQKAKDQRNVDPDITPYLGFELEIEAIGENTSRAQGSLILRDIASPWAYAVHDGTLLDSGQRGFEVVTHPFTFNWFNENWNTIEILLDTYRNAGYRSWEGGRCGMHVHISRAPMTEAHQMKFIQFIYGSSNLAMAVGQRGPRDRALAQFAPFDRENRSEFINKIRRNVNPGADGHYAALSATQPSTYEARWFRGTLQPDSFRKNIEFVHAVWMFTRKFGFASSNEINFIEWLRDPRYRSDYGTLLEYLEQHYVTRR